MSRRKQQIIDASIDILWRQGYAAFSIGALADALGVSKGVITYHFQQKEQIVEVLVRQFYEAAAAYVAERMSMASSWDALQSYIRACLSFADENRKDVLAITEIILNSRDDKGGLRFADPTALYGPVMEILNYGKTDGDFKQFDSYIMARLIRAAIDDISGAIARGEVEDVSSTIQETVTLFYNATKKEIE